ncbi:MAG TPA: asparagine synthase (glutamine-hydrolyzing) [Bacteroidetes bacterium]|nr:asparagine synthase (glutamine-hydrolyzing) [Bacteroidota bacterium]
MCGIIGSVSLHSSRFIEKATVAISHRGPDDTGIFVEGNLALGHQRLSILDLSAKGHQPMISENKNLVIIYNGEIYNHLELRAKIGDAYRFESHSDTETILAGYQKYGTDLFNMLNGIFAFAIYDRSKKELIVCRDQLGVKPLYFYSYNNEFIFGSEIKSFLQFPELNKELDYESLVNYLHFLYSPGEKTPFKYVKKLLPGHYLKINIENPDQRDYIKYYEIPFTGKYKESCQEGWTENIDYYLNQAVKRQLLSDVPVGFYLSGGLDSSLLVAMARKITGKKLNTYTIDTDMTKDNIEGFANDLHYAKKVAKYLDVDLEIVKSDVDIVRDFDKMIWHLDEPQADAAPLNVLNISRQARASGDFVMIGGTGGDDLFSGYRRHRAVNMEKLFKNSPGFFMNGLKRISESLPQSNPLFRRMAKILKHGNLSQKERLAGYFEWLAPDINKSLFNTGIHNKISGYNPSNILLNSLNNIKNEKEILNHLLYWEMKYFLPDHNLNYTDKMSMAVGIETRVPFLDLELVELSTRIPVKYKMRGRNTKYILKKTAEKYLPKEVIYRPKTGFGAPVRKWIINDLDEMIHEYLSPKQIKERGIFDEKNIWNLIENNKSGNIDASYSVWSLLAIESWMRQFVDNG